MHAISRDEWRWVRNCAVALVLLVVIPYTLAIVRPPEGYYLARTLYYGNDLSQYLAAMGDGASSPSWLIQDHLTSEPHNPAFMYPFYVFLGKIAGLAGIPPIVLFSLAVAFSIPALAFAGYAFAAAFADFPRERRISLLLLLFASGVGIWVAAAGTSDSSAESASTVFSFDRAEVSTFLLPFGPPHLTLSFAVMLVWGRSLAAWAWNGSSKELAILVLGVLGVAFLNPFSLATLVALAGGYALVRWISTGRFPLREMGAAMLVGVVAAPLLAVNLMTFARDPFWSLTYGQQNTTGSPPVWVMALDFGLLLPLAAAGAVSGKARLESRLLLGFWVLGLLALMYLPVPFQRRFGFGLQPALAVLAGLGATWLDDLSRMKRVIPLFRLALRTLCAVTLFSGTMLGLALFSMAADGIGPLGSAIFEPQGNVAAGDWLAGHSDGRDVVLASVETGNYLAGRIRGRVVAGHKAGTLDESAKEKLVQSFFGPTATSPDWRQMTSSQRVTLVFVGKRERALGGVALGAEYGFSLVYDADGVQIYRVEQLSS
jgi:hypothetical protein